MSRLGTYLQFLRFSLIGLFSNSLLFVLYLGFTGIGLGHKTAMTLMWIFGIVQTFVVNKKWSFQDNGAYSWTFVRYLTVYALVYVLNFIMMVMLVDSAGLPHWIVQGAMMFINGLVIFCLLKSWVFVGDPVMINKV